MATVKKDKKKKAIVAICVVLVVAIIAGAIFGIAKANSGESVSLYTISSDDIYETVSLTGEVTSGASKEYKVSTVATVKEVFVSVGDQVKKGDVLATFNVDELNSQVTSLQNTYNDALNSYNAAVKSQKTAKSNADALEKKIAALQKEVSQLEAQDDTLTTAKKTTTKKATTAPSKTTTKATTTTTTTTTSTTNADSQDQPTLNDLAQSLEELNQTLTEITQDLNTLTTSMEVISTTIAQLAGSLDSEEIANQIVQNLVDSGIAENVAQQIVASIDIDEIVNSVSNTKNAKLTAAEIQLVSLQAQYAIFSAQADDTILKTQEKAVEASKTALDTLKEQKEEMENGWIAAFDGTITEVDITEGMQTTLISTGIKLENLDSMAVTVSLGEYDLHKVKVGMEATVTTAYGKYQGEVISIAPTATGGSGTNILDSVGSMAGISGLSSLTDSGAGVECVISIPETDENIIAGFDADVEIATGEYLGVTVVPIESIKLEKTGSYVYLYNEEDGTVTKTLIETGAVSDSSYEVTSGLKVGDKIISAPSSDYEEDTFKVKVTEK